MIYLSCDGSFKDGMGGMAVIAPSGFPPSKDIKVFPIQKTGQEAHVASCRCSSANEAETMAMAMAVELASTILNSHPDEKIEISTDSLITLHGVLHDQEGVRGRDVIQDMIDHHRGKIMISKVKAHRGNKDNELADLWSKKARRETERGNRYGNSRASRAPSPSDGNTLRGTEKLLENSGSDIVAVITKEGFIMPLNEALKGGDPFPTELYKESRVWGSPSFHTVKKPRTVRIENPL